jgi:hypothetical protein
MPQHLAFGWNQDCALFGWPEWAGAALMAVEQPEDFELHWRTVTVKVSVKERLCVNCGKRFLPRVVVGGTTNRGTAPAFKISGAKTCGTACANQLRGEMIIEAHERAKTDPERYRQWVGRDYSAMGKRRHGIQQ